MITEYDFELPRGYVDANGNVHRKGKMRLGMTGGQRKLPLFLPLLL